MENVELPLISAVSGKEERKRLAVEALTRVGLEKRLTHRPMQMSGGQQQRVAIDQGHCRPSAYDLSR